MSMELVSGEEAMHHANALTRHASLINVGRQLCMSCIELSCLRYCNTRNGTYWIVLVMRMCSALVRNFRVLTESGLLQLGNQAHGMEHYGSETH